MKLSSVGSFFLKECIFIDFHVKPLLVSNHQLQLAVVVTTTCHNIRDSWLYGYLVIKIYLPLNLLPKVFSFFFFYKNME